MRKAAAQMAETFQLRVTCRRGQVISMSMDYYAPGGGGEGVASSLNLSFLVCVFLLRFFSLKTSPESYIIYRIVNCVSVI